jgi:hypothetical protein
MLQSSKGRVGMSYTTYYGRELKKFGASLVVAGSDDAASAAAAAMKVEELGNVLQRHFQARNMEFDGSDICIDDCRSAILYARGKKNTKAVRRAAVGTAKSALQIAAIAGGVTVGSVIPVAGNLAGAVGGAVAGSSLGAFVTVGDRLMRMGKGIYKMAAGTRGVHREQAAEALLHCAQDGHLHRHAARWALVIILGDEYEEVMRRQDVDRLASRLKSN